MERTTHWAALYFVLLMTFGNYVLFNLLVAILVEGFSKQDELFDASQAKSLDHQNSFEESKKMMKKTPENTGVKMEVVTDQEDSDVEVYTKSNAVKGAFIKYNRSCLIYSWSMTRGDAKKIQHFKYSFCEYKFEEKKIHKEGISEPF